MIRQLTATPESDRELAHPLPAPSEAVALRSVSKV